MTVKEQERLMRAMEIFYERKAVGTPPDDQQSPPALRDHDRATAGTNLVSKHGFTCGPYVVSESLDEDGNIQGLLIKPYGGQVVAEVDPLENAESNARLLAAAPELFDALERAIPFIIAGDANRTSGEGVLLLQVIRNIISNITGEQE